MPAATSLSAWRQRFAGLPPVTGPVSPCFFRAGFVGPAWLCRIAPGAVALGGLPGWAGKRFTTPGLAVNVLEGGDGLREVMPMRVAQGVSLLDDRPALVLIYGAGSPLLWRRVRDELRVLDAERWLGMTVIDVPGLRRLGWPFLLTRVPGT